MIIYNQKMKERKNHNLMRKKINLKKNEKNLLIFQKKDDIIKSSKEKRKDI